jgi:flagellar FliL protein
LIQAPRRTEEHAILVERMIEDTLIYIQTLTPTLLEGAIGLANLKQNLTDRAATRSNGLVKEVFIRAMVLQ